MASYLTLERGSRHRVAPARELGLAPLRRHRRREAPVEPSQLRATLTDAELDYLVRNEWARTAADVVWRRTKLGLRLSRDQLTAIEAAVDARVDEPVRVQA